MKDHPRTGHPVMDAILMAWGMLVSMLAIETLQSALGVLVAALTALVLSLRIYILIRDDILTPKEEKTDA